jgi:predicted RNase H-like HicB family nuclease
MKYTVVIKESDEGYSIACPALPGCWSQGKSEEEAVANISEAIQDYLAAISDTYKEEQYRHATIQR